MYIYELLKIRKNKIKIHIDLNHLQLGTYFDTGTAGNE
jgi:hypothetical protein